MKYHEMTEEQKQERYNQCMDRLAKWAYGMDPRQKKETKKEAK